MCKEMFQVREKETGRVHTVYNVTENGFLVWDEDAESFVTLSQAVCAPFYPDCHDEPVNASQTGAEAKDALFTAAHVSDGSLSDILDRIVHGDMPVAVGDSIITKLLDGTEVDFVVTDFDGESIRFETRDCLGKYVPMTQIDDFFSEVWRKLPDAFKRHIIPTDRKHLDKNGDPFEETVNLFLPAASEVFPDDDCYGDRGLYQQMDWYKDVHNRVRAFQKGGYTDWYWTGSRYAGHTTAWCFVYNIGSAYSNYASYANIAAPVCFRVHRI